MIKIGKIRGCYRGDTYIEIGRIRRCYRGDTRIKIGRYEGVIGAIQGLR